MPSLPAAFSSSNPAAPPPGLLPLSLMLTYHPENHGSGVGALGIGGHTGVVPSILEAYVLQAEGQDFVVMIVTEVGLLSDFEL